MERISRGIEGLAIPNQNVTGISACNKPLTVFYPFQSELILLLLVSKFGYKLRRSSFPIVAWICIVLRKVKLAVRVVRQNCWCVTALKIKLSKLPIIVFACVRIESCLDSLRTVVKLRPNLKWVGIHYLKIYY